MNGIESVHGRALTEWARLHRDPVVRMLYHIPNGGNRSKGVAGKLKAEGVLAGVWDYHLPVATHQRPGLWIELKAPKERTHKHGGLSDPQVKFGRHLVGQGYACIVAYDWLDAAQAIEAYLAGRAFPLWDGG